MDRLEKDGKYIPYIVKTKRNRHAYFRVKNDYVEITKHPNMALEPLLTLLLNRFDKWYPLLNVSKEFKLFNEPFKLTYLIGNSFSYQILIDRIEIIHPTKMTELEAKNQVLLMETKQRIQLLNPHIESIIKKQGLTLKPTKVKWLKSKYGSCQILKEEITINAFLATLDPIYLEYVLLHEYAHLIVPSHQKAFYDVLDGFMPNHKAVQKSLRTHRI